MEFAKGGNNDAIQGKGGAAGFAKGGAKVRLEDAGDGTLLVYEAEVRVGGKLAQLGSRLIGGFAKKMANDFFDRLQEAIEEPAEESSEAPEAESEAPEEKKKGWFKRLIS